MGHQSPVVHRTEGRILESFSRNWLQDCRNNYVESLIVWDQMHTRRIAIELEDISGHCEFACLEPGLYLSALDLNLPTTFKTKVVGEDLIEFNFRLLGDISLNGKWGQVNVDRPSTLIWYQPEGHDDVWEELGNSNTPHERSVTLYCARWWVQRLIYAQNSIGDALGSILAGKNGEPAYQVLGSPSGSATTIRTVFGSDETGPLRLLFLKAKGYELLGSTLRLLMETSDRPSDKRYFTDRDRENIAQAKEILEREYITPPSVSKLARIVGVNESKLNLGLRQLHGSTAQQIVRERRLERARELLSATDLPVSEVGFRIGYAHHSTFTAAFVERFGMSPKRFALAHRQWDR
jgi:AraC-like DNA-binding protein